MRYKVSNLPSARHLLSAPFVYLVFIPLAFLDVFVEIYHQIGFRLLELETVKRSDYIKIDRHKLKYLKFHDKLNCMYCGYANGFFNYAGEIAARTEDYWCSIKHAGRQGFNEPEHHKDYVEYGDKDAFEEKFEKGRSSVAEYELDAE